jgi:hypothetical protein
VQCMLRVFGGEVPGEELADAVGWVVGDAVQDLADQHLSFVLTPAFESTYSTTLLEPDPNSRMSTGSLSRTSTLMS